MCPIATITSVICSIDSPNRRFNKIIGQPRRRVRNFGLSIEASAIANLRERALWAMRQIRSPISSDVVANRCLTRVITRRGGGDRIDGITKLDSIGDVFGCWQPNDGVFFYNLGSSGLSVASFGWSRRPRRSSSGTRHDVHRAEVAIDLNGRQCVRSSKNQNFIVVGGCNLPSQLICS